MPHCRKCGAPSYHGRCLCPPPKDPDPWVVVFDAPGFSIVRRPSGLEFLLRKS